MAARDTSERRAAYILILVFVLLAAGIVAAGTLYFRKYEKRHRVEAERQLSAIADLKAGELAAWRGERLRDAAVFYKNTAFSALVRRCFDNPEDLEAQGQLLTWLRQVQAAYEYDRVCLHDATGLERISVPEAPEPVASVFSQRASEVLRSGQVAFEDFYRDEHNQRIYLSVLIPVLDGEDGSRPIGILAFRIDPEQYLYPLISRWPTPSPTAETLIVRREGNDALFLNELRFQVNTALKLRIPLWETELPSLKAVLGHEGIVEGQDYRGVSVIADVRAVPGAPWFLVARVDVSEVYAPVRERLWLMVALISALLLASGACVGLLWRQQSTRFSRERGEAAQTLRQSEERFRVASQSITDVIWEWDLATGRLDWFGDIDGLLGYGPGEFSRTIEAWEMLIDPEDRDHVMSALDGHITAGDPYDLEYRVRRRDGGTSYWHDQGTAIRDAQGKAVRMVGGIADVTERKRAETALQESEERFRALAEHSIDTIMRFDHQHRCLYVNPIVERGTGIAPEAFIGKTNREMGFPEDQCMLWADAIEKVLQTGKVNRIEFKLPTGMWLDWLLAPEFDALGKVSAVVTAARDITERKNAEADRERIEAELRQAQKMEAVGLLAGGVAHDFNNMLNVILGYAEIALSSLNARDPLYQHLLEIKKAGLRSADLTRQLLAFSRKQIVEPRVLHLNEVIANQQQMLARLIGEDIQIDFVPAGDLWTIRVDPVQIDQILANLAVNARDAIAGVGTVSVETANVVLDETYIRNHVYVTPGEYVMLAFSDTGAGMDADTLKRIFEPFFTTKDKAKGTGLGLSTVFGIVKQNKGFIHAYSELGMGTTFKIYFPRFRGKAAAPAEKAEAASGTGTETVLVVEDEQQVLSLAREVLERYGYQVLTARTPDEACQLVEKHEGRIHLLLTDVVMPAMNGKELQTRIQKIKPGLKTLFMSGYTANVIAQHGVLEEGVEFLQKPFSVASLAQKVRQVLDA